MQGRSGSERAQKTPAVEGMRLADPKGVARRQLIVTVVTAAFAAVVNAGIVGAQTARTSQDRQGSFRISGLPRVPAPRRFVISTPPWVDRKSSTKLPRYPFAADPRRWPRLFANTTECALSFSPVTRRHWWQ